jgi:hypothetical protein
MIQQTQQHVAEDRYGKRSMVLARTDIEGLK